MAKRKLLALCLGFSTFLLLSGFFPPAGTSPVSASPDELWEFITTPSEEGNVVLSPSELNALVPGPDDETFYAIDIPHSKIYKSSDGGITWEDDITDNLADEGATLPVWDIAVAPDDPEFVAVVTNNRTAVYLSDDGGVNWVDANVPDLGTLLISDIAISWEYGSSDRDIAIGTRNPDTATGGDIWVVSLKGIAAWQNIELNMDVSSVAFSPGYGDDRAILAIASNTTGTYLCDRQKILDNWEDVVPPTEIKESGSSPKESELIVSDFTLPSADYSRDAAWTVYAAYYSTTEADDAYRIKHGDGEDFAYVSRLDINKGDKISLASIDYSDGKLLAGEVLADADSASALIHICSNPGETFPEWEGPTEPPTGGAVSGNANAQVIWSSDGKTAYCGTSSNHVEDADDWADMTFGPWSGQSLDESAFSVSKDGGDTWNQLSLIDTDMHKLCDYALSVETEDSKTHFCLYLASAGSGFDSLWRSESEELETLGDIWERILCFSSGTDEIVLRPTPEESAEEAIFFAAIETEQAGYSLNKGESWKEVWDCPHITDLAVASNEMFYILDDDLLHKCVWTEQAWGAGWVWQEDVEIELPHAYIMSIVGEEYVFIAQDENGEGKLAYSCDGGATFELTEALPAPGNTGNMQMTPDEEFYGNRFIYATSDAGKIYRWTIEGSTSWLNLNPPHSGFSGLAQRGDTLYGAYGPGVDRTLIPHLKTIHTSDWDSLEAGLASGVSFKPGSLRAVRNEDKKSIDLWAIDGRDYDFPDDEGCLRIYSDTFALQTPWPTSPALGELMPCNLCTCQAETFCFRWRELALTEEYELWIAPDEEFTAIIVQAQNIRPIDLHNPTWCPPKNSPPFICGDTYYWKVRSCESTEGETIHSRWSPPMHFTVKVCSSEEEEVYIAPVLLYPADGSTGIPRAPSFSWQGFPSTTKYEFILARDAALTQVIIEQRVSVPPYLSPQTLDWGQTYFWQVKAVEPVPSESASATFTVMSQPQPPISPTQATPLWVWAIIAILAILNVIVIALCVIQR